MIGQGHIAIGQLLALLIAAAELGFVIYAMIRRPRRQRHWLETASRSTVTAAATVGTWATRPRTGNCEEVIVRQRLAGLIDAATYQARMADLVRSGRS
jgi:hypothetical protein